MYIPIFCKNLQFTISKIRQTELQNSFHLSYFSILGLNELNKLILLLKDNLQNKYGIITKVLQKRCDQAALHEDI